MKPLPYAKTYLFVNWTFYHGQHLLFKPADIRTSRHAGNLSSVSRLVTNSSIRTYCFCLILSRQERRNWRPFFRRASRGAWPSRSVDASFCYHQSSIIVKPSLNYVCSSKMGKLQPLLENTV